MAMLPQELAHPAQQSQEVRGRHGFVADLAEGPVLVHLVAKLISLGQPAIIEPAQPGTVKPATMLVPGCSGLRPLGLFFVARPGRSASTLQADIEDAPGRHPRRVQCLGQILELRQRPEIREQLQFQPVIQKDRIEFPGA